MHRGTGSLRDTQRIISLYTEHSDQIAPVIDDLTLRKEFIVFDLRRSRSDPLSIRVRWDTSIWTILNDQKLKNTSSAPSECPLEAKSTQDSIKDDIGSKFSPYGRKILAESKKNGSLLDFARNMPSPKERKKILANGINTKNSDIWAKYVYREAFCIKGKDLGTGWTKFESQLKSPITKESQLKYYKELLASRPLDDKKMLEGLEILLWLIKNGYIDRKIYISGVTEICS